MTDLHFLTIAQASAQIKARTLSPVELTQAFLARVERFDPRLNVDCSVLEEQALADAKKANPRSPQAIGRDPCTASRSD